MSFLPKEASVGHEKGGHGNWAEEEDIETDFLAAGLLDVW